MNKRIKKIISIVLIIMLTFSNSLTLLAEDINLGTMIENEKEISEEKQSEEEKEKLSLRQDEEKSLSEKEEEQKEEQEKQEEQNEQAKQEKSEEEEKNQDEEKIDREDERKIDNKEEEKATKSDIEEEKQEKELEEEQEESIIIVSTESTVEEKILVTNNEATESETEEEIIRKGLGYEPLERETARAKKKNRKGLYGDIVLQKSYDSRNEQNKYGLSIIPPVRDQGSHDTCWAFSTIGMVEASIRKHDLVDNEKDSNLSELALAYFTFNLKDVTNNSLYADKPGNGGRDYLEKLGSVFSVGGYNQYQAALIASSYMGVVIEDENTKYENIDNVKINGLDKKYAFNNNGFEITDFIVMNKNDVDIVKEAIVNYGAVGIGYCESRDYTNCHKIGDEWYYCSEEGRQDNHAVLIVGWNDDVPKENFYNSMGGTPKKNGAWLVRNSWGDNNSLCKGGYFWLSYEDKTMATNVYAVNAVKADTYKYNYHYDTTSLMRYEKITIDNYGEKAAANIFKVSDDFDQTLDAISIGLETGNAKFNIEIYTKDTEMSSPTDGTKQIVQEVNKDFEGIFTIPLDKKVELKKGTYFSIVIDAKTNFNIWCDDYALDGVKYNYYNEAALNQSFLGIKSWNYWTDYNYDYYNKKSLLIEENGVQYGSNFRIKALTNPVEGGEEEPIGDIEKDYTLPNNWYNESSAGIAKSSVKKISISQYPNAAPQNAEKTWEVNNSNGLKVYLKNNEITIYAKTKGKIYAAEDSSYLFSDSKPTSAGFSNITAIEGLNLLDTSNVKNMKAMFSGCQYVTSLDLSNFNTEKVEDMSEMFYFCRYLMSIDLSKFNTANVKKMSEMFFSLYQPKSIDVSNFNTSNVTKMNGMFNGCKSLESINLTNFNTEKVTDMSYMFAGCGELTTIDLSSFNTSEVTNMSHMFEMNLVESKFVTLDLTKFNTKKVTETIQMFYKCKSLKTIYVSENFDLTNVTEKNSSFMFGDCISLVGGNNTVYSEANVNKTFARIDKEGSPGYFTDDMGSIVSVQISKKSTNKTTYKEGEFFNPEGLIVEIEYSKGGTKEVTYNKKDTKWQFNPKLDAALVSTNKKIEIIYSGYKLEQAITVVGIDSISVSKDPKKKYEVGEFFDPTGLEITIIYKDKSTHPVSYNEQTKKEFSFSKQDSFKEKDGATQVITIAYKGQTVNLNVTVRYLDTISVEKTPTKEKYKIDEYFDPSGLVINLNYSDNPTLIPTVTYSEENKSKFKFNGQEKVLLNTASNNYKIEIEYEGKTADIYVAVADITGIRIKEKPKKLEYMAGEVFSLDGVEIYIDYSDGDTYEKEYVKEKNNFSFEPKVGLTRANKTVKIIYKEKEAEQKINVKEIFEIKMKTTPSTTLYNTGEKINPSGLTIECFYLDSEDKTTNEIITYSDANKNKWSFNPSLTTLLNENNKTVTITYGGKTAVYNIAVNAAKEEKPSNNKSDSVSGNRGGSTSGVPMGQMPQNQQRPQITPQANVAVNQSKYGTMAAMSMEPVKNLVSTVAGNVMKFMKENGEKITGFQKVSVNNQEGYYYFNKDSSLYCGLMKDENNNIHYFGADGKMVTNAQITIGNMKYNINVNGEVEQTNLNAEQKSYIFSNCGLQLYSGETTRDPVTNDWTTYIINPITGRRELARGMIQLVQEDGVNTYFFDAIGRLQTGFQFVNGAILFFSPFDGKLVQ